MKSKTPPEPTHVKGAAKGEELASTHGREPGRSPDGKAPYRNYRDSTGIDPEGRAPIDPAMPQMPPA